MKRIKKFKDYTTINESIVETGFSPGSSFGQSDLATVNGGGLAPRDKDLSMDGLDTHKNNIKTRMQTMSDIMTNVFASGDIQLSKDLVDVIEDLSIVKIFRNMNNSLDIYLKFLYEEEVFYGSFKKWGDFSEPIFKSKIFDIPAIGNYKENRIKVENILKKVLESWFIPKKSTYVALQNVKTYDMMGNICNLPKGGKIIIDNIILDDYRPEIEFMYNNHKYTIKGLDYYYFNWWFNPEQEQEFFL